MAKTRFPKTRNWRGQFPGEKKGDISSGFNLDLQRNQGTIHIAEKLQELFNSGDDADFGVPTGFILSNSDSTNRYWVVAGSVLFKSNANDPEAGWAQDAISSSPIDARDRMIEFANDMYVPTTTDIDRLASGTWTNPFWSAQSGGSALQSGVFHGMTISPIANLLIADGRFINEWDGTTATDPTLTLPSQFEITDMQTINDYTVIAVNDLNKSDANIFFWNGTDSTYNFRYPTGTTRVMAIIAQKDTHFIITLEGQIKKFTGSGYDVVQEFPTYATGSSVSSVHTASLEGKIGISLLAGGDVIGPNGNRGFDGIWLFDPNNFDLYPRYALTASAVLSGDIGHSVIASSAGAILETVIGSGRLLTGGRIYTIYTGTTIFVLNSSMETNTSSARANFTTQKIETSDAKEFWRQVLLIFKRFRDSGDRIIVKYKILKDVNLPLVRAITWASTTTFTVSTTAFLSVGDEVFVIAGANAGRTSHITDISGTTITIDETEGSSSAVALAVFDNWTKLGTVSTQNLQREIFKIRQKSSFIQFKFDLRGDETSPEIQIVQAEHESRSI